MKLIAKYGFMRSQDAAWTAGLFLMLALSFAGLDRTPAPSDALYHRGRKSQSLRHWRERNFRIDRSFRNQELLHGL